MKKKDDVRFREAMGERIGCYNAASDSDQNTCEFLADLRIVTFASPPYSPPKVEKADARTDDGLGILLTCSVCGRKSKERFWPGDFLETDTGRSYGTVQWKCPVCFHKPVNPIPPQGNIPRCKHGTYAPEGDTSSCEICNPVIPVPKKESSKHEKRCSKWPRSGFGKPVLFSETYEHAKRICTKRFGKFAEHEKVKSYWIRLDENGCAPAWDFTARGQHKYDCQALRESLSAVDAAPDPSGEKVYLVPNLAFENTDVLAEERDDPYYSGLAGGWDSLGTQEEPDADSPSDPEVAEETQKEVREEFEEECADLEGSEIDEATEESVDDGEENETEDETSDNEAPSAQEVAESGQCVVAGEDECPCPPWLREQERAVQRAVRKLPKRDWRYASASKLITLKKPDEEDRRVWWACQSFGQRTSVEHRWEPGVWVKDESGQWKFEDKMDWVEKKGKDGRVIREEAYEKIDGVKVLTWTRYEQNGKTFHRYVRGYDKKTAMKANRPDKTGRAYPDSERFHLVRRRLHSDLKNRLGVWDIANADKGSMRQVFFTPYLDGHGPLHWICLVRAGTEDWVLRPDKRGGLYSKLPEFYPAWPTERPFPTGDYPIQIDAARSRHALTSPIPDLEEPKCRLCGRIEEEHCYRHLREEEMWTRVGKHLSTQFCAAAKAEDVEEVAVLTAALKTVRKARDDWGLNKEACRRCGHPFWKHRRVCRFCGGNDREFFDAHPVYRCVDCKCANFRAGSGCTDFWPEDNPAHALFEKRDAKVWRRFEIEQLNWGTTKPNCLADRRRYYRVTRTLEQRKLFPWDPKDALRDFMDDVRSHKAINPAVNLRNVQPKKIAMGEYGWKDRQSSKDRAAQIGMAENLRFVSSRTLSKWKDINPMPVDRWVPRELGAKWVVTRKPSAENNWSREWVYQVDEDQEVEELCATIDHFIWCEILFGALRECIDRPISRLGDLTSRIFLIQEGDKRRYPPPPSYHTHVWGINFDASTLQLPGITQLEFLRTHRRVLAAGQFEAVASDGDLRCQVPIRVDNAPWSRSGALCTIWGPQFVYFPYQ